MNTIKNNIIVITKDGTKYLGTLQKIDKVNEKVILSQVTKTFQGKEENLDSIEVAKNDISEYKALEIVNKTEDVPNFNAIPDNKVNNINQNQIENLDKAYDKSKDFFDGLKNVTNSEAKKESKLFNDKNKDTFNMTEKELNQDYNDKNNYYKKYGKNNLRGYNRGRGGYNRGRYNNNNRQYYNNNYNNYNNNYYQQNNNNYYNNYNNRGRQNRGRGGRGRGKNRGNFKNNNNNNFDDSKKVEDNKQNEVNKEKEENK